VLPGGLGSVWVLLRDLVVGRLTRTAPEVSVEVDVDVDPAGPIATEPA